MLPFSVEQFFTLFARYNLTIWPAQLVAYALAGLLLWSIAVRQAWSWRVVALVLGIFWLWNGIVYHLAFFSRINPAAYGFAALFVVQGAALMISGLQASNTRIVVERNACTATAAGLILYAMVVYSIIGTLGGHGWPHAPMFGVAPCPTTIFTLGILILVNRVAPLWLAIIPVTWALIGSTAAVLLGVSEDLGLLAAVAALAACRWKSRPC